MTLRAALVCLLVVAPGRAAEPEKVDLFEAGRGGYALYRIPGVVVTAKGTLLAYCEARKSAGDWADIDILLRRSTDGGKTWEPARRVAHIGPAVPQNPVGPKKRAATDRTVNNPVAVTDPVGGSVHFLYCVEYRRCFYQRSDDDGRTYSPPADITAAFEEFRPKYDWKVIAAGPGHGIRLATGRLVVAVWLSLGTGRGGHHPSVAATVFSDDGGKTWHAGEIAVPNTSEFVDPNETAVAELADGRVMLNVRNESARHRRLVTTSKDGATGWTPPAFADDLFESVCMGSLARTTAGGRSRLLYAAPHNPLPAAADREPPKGWRDRKNLSVRLSDDDGKTWPLGKTLEAGPSAYSDLAVGPDGTIYCLYERGQPEGPAAKATPYGRLTLARFPLDWLTAGMGQ